MYLRKKKKKNQIQVSESCFPFMCNYQCISTGCAIIFIVTFIHVMPLLIWLRYELLTVIVLVEMGWGKVKYLQRAKTRQLYRHGKADQLQSAQKANSRDEHCYPHTTEFPSFPPFFFN